MIELLLNNGIFPALAAGALLLAGGRRYADFGIGAAAAFLVVWLADNAWSWPGWPPADSKAAMPFGVLFAAIVTLLLVPCLYVVLEDLKHLRHRRSQHPAEEGHPGTVPMAGG